MSAIPRTASAIALVYPTRAERYNSQLAEPFEEGQCGSIDANGRMEISDGTTFRGIALGHGGAEAGVSFIRKGHISGYDLSGLAPDDLVFAGAAGELDTAGTAVVGRVECMPDEPNLTKVLYVLDTDWGTVPAGP